MTTVTPLVASSLQRPRSGFRPDIQGLRAIAVLLVVFYHAGVPIISGGYIGVDVFFVVSGFLITTHLLESVQNHGGISLTQFYAHRARRILPAAFTVLVATVLASVAWMPPMQMTSVLKGAVASVFYVPNMLFAFEGTNYLAETAPSVFQHYWSLGIEEQFYLAWPLLLILSFRFLKSERSVFWVIAIFVVASFILCQLVQPISQPWAFFSLPTRAWELGAGALVAFLMRARVHQLRSFRCGLLAWVGLCSLLIIAFIFDSKTLFPSYYAAAPVIATALIIVGGAARMSPMRLLSIKPMQFVGLISYSLYLVHWPLLVIPQAALGQHNPLPLSVTLALGTLSIPLAYLLFRFIEDPARKSTFLSQAKPALSFLVLVGVSALICVLIVASLAFSQRQSLNSGQIAEPVALAEFPAGTPFVPTNMSPSLRATSDDLPIVYDNGCLQDHTSTNSDGCQFGTNADAPVVALFGDSHAATWVPALHHMAEQGRIQLAVYTKSACHSANVPALRSGVPYKSCDEWRQGVINKLRSDKPEVILMANYGTYYLENGTVSSREQWGAAIENTIGMLSEESHVGVMADVPNMGQTPAICLSNNLDAAAKCALPREEALDNSMMEKERHAAESLGEHYIDMTSYMCNFKSCPAIIGNELVYRDAHHLTATFSQSLGSQLSSNIERLIR